MASSDPAGRTSDPVAPRIAQRVRPPGSIHILNANLDHRTIQVYEIFNVNVMIEAIERMNVSKSIYTQTIESAKK